jgi:hypothetical protein
MSHPRGELCSMWFSTFPAEPRSTTFLQEKLADAKRWVASGRSVAKYTQEAFAIMKWLQNNYTGPFFIPHFLDERLPCFYLMELDVNARYLHMHDGTFFTKSEVRHALTPKQVQVYLKWVIVRLEAEQVVLQKNLCRVEQFIAQMEKYFFQRHPDRLRGFVHPSLL